MNRQEKLFKVKKALLAMQRWPWEQGVAAQAFLEAGDMEVAALMAFEAVTNRWKDGRLAMKYDRGAATDPAANGEAVLRVGEALKEERLINAAKGMLEYLLYRAPKTRDGIIYHNENEGRIWADAFYMAPPFLAVAGCPEEAVKQIAGYHKILWDRDKKLYYHQWDDDEKRYCRQLHWGVGSGWATAGIVRVLKALPGNMGNEKELLLGYLKEVIDGCLAYQLDNGLFHDIVDDSSTFIETNLAQMLSYSIYRGIVYGYLEESYAKSADKMRLAAYSKVDEFGLVRDVCGAPGFESAGTAPEGQAFFILMEAAYNNYLNFLQNH
ncbi:MAG TPA: glycoside hydrolase family 88 protein [Ruminiclostridium sp.]|nr:glycoside hydrolase family 88 protein [Ruminiclostridium sp.]